MNVLKLYNCTFIFLKTSRSSANQSYIC